MKNEDCYIVWEDNRIYMQCVECYEKNKKGVFWSADNGYGLWDIKCPCGHMIQVIGDEE